MTIAMFVSRHFQSAVAALKPRPALDAREDRALSDLMQRICAARPAARAAGNASAPAQAMISAMQTYQAEMLNTCMTSLTPEAAAYRQARASGGDSLQMAELAVLRHSGNKKLHGAFENMLRTGQDYLKLQARASMTSPRP